MAISLDTVALDKPEDVNVILGQTHFIKTVEDLHEALAGVSSYLRFGIAFCAVSAAAAIAAGHTFVIMLRDGFPVNVLNQVKAVPEVCTIFCATANPVDVLVAVTERGRGVVGVVDGEPPAGTETAEDEETRRQLLRTLGYKL